MVGIQGYNADSLYGIKENTIESAEIQKAKKPVEKAEKAVDMTTKRISALGELKMFMEDFQKQIFKFSYDNLQSFTKDGVFDKLAVIVPNELSNYAKITPSAEATKQILNFQIDAVAEGEILLSKDNFKKTDVFHDKISSYFGLQDKGEVTFTVLDNGFKSNDFLDKNDVVGSGNGGVKFNPGEFSIDSSANPGIFSIGSSANITIEIGDSLDSIATKINKITRNTEESQNPHVEAKVIKDGTNYFLSVKSDKNHHGIQNAFVINDPNSILNGNLGTNYNEKIEVAFSTAQTVENFLTNLKSNARRADVEVVFNPLSTGEGKIELKSLLTGIGNEIQLDTESKAIFNTIRAAKDAKIKLDGVEITSKSNKFSTQNLNVELLGIPTVVQTQGDSSKVQKYQNAKDTINSFLVNQLDNYTNKQAIDIGAKNLMDQVIAIIGDTSITDSILGDVNAVDYNSGNISAVIGRVRDFFNAQLLYLSTKISEEIDASSSSGSSQMFNLKIDHDTAGIYEKFDSMANSYNGLSEFLAKQSLKVQDLDTYSKPAIEAPLQKDYSTTIDFLRNQLDSFFQPLIQYGIKISGQEFTLPTKEVDGVKQEYLPSTIYKMEIDESKLKQSIAQYFNTLKDLMNLEFESSSPKFLFFDNQKDFSFDNAGIKDILYNIDYTKVRYMKNVSSQFTDVNTAVNSGLSGTKYFMINDQKLKIAASTSYKGLIKEINRWQSKTGISAYLVNNSDNVVSEDNPTGSSFQIALSIKDGVSGSDALSKQDNLRSKLTVVDPENALNDIFSSTDTSLDETTASTMFDGKIPQINFYNTIDVVDLKSTTRNFDEVSLQGYMQLSDSKDITKGGTIIILPDMTTLKQNNMIRNLENFEVYYLSDNNPGISVISAKQGLASKASHLLVSTTKGLIETFVMQENNDKVSEVDKLQNEKKRYKEAEAKAKQNAAARKAAEYKAWGQEEFMKQMNKNDL
ncbi:MAG: hypothetical protein ACI8ZF_000557 [Candidatus Midichloriaceae bacterium]|jgi:hypothetical protein